MAECESNKIDSNITGLSFAEERCLKELPVAGPAVAATGSITLLTNPLAGDTVTVNGVEYEFVASGAAGDQVDIGANAGETATALATAIGADADVDAVAAGSVVTVTATNEGAAGNEITLASPSASIGLSAGTLRGGEDEQFDPVWYELEPNSYSDLGGELTTVARSPIDPSRQNKKGTVTDLDASGGLNQDFTQTNTNRLLQGFFFADVRQPPTTEPMNGQRTDIAAVTATQYQAAAGLGDFTAGMLLLASLFGVPANNGLKRSTAAASGSVTVAEALVAEAAPPSGAKLDVVGFQFPSGDVALALAGNQVSLTSTATNLITLFASLKLIPGAWVYFGGDAAATRFDGAVGFARIGAIGQNSVQLDDISWPAAAASGAGKTVQMFVPFTIRNEKDSSLIKRRSYQIERTLGDGEVGPQAEYLEGAVANEFTLNVPLADKLNADLTFVACNNTFRSGNPGDEVKHGVHIPAPGEDAYNTSNDIWRLKLSVVTPGTSNPDTLFGYMTEGNISISNGVTPNKALGVLGAFDTSAGNFVVSGSITAYFTTVAACKAIRNNADVGLSTIYAARNEGFLFDIPLLGLGGGRITVEKDQPIMIPVTPNGAESKFGHTLLYANFPYLPNVAMPEN